MSVFNVRGTTSACDLAEVRRALTIITDPAAGVFVQALPSGRWRVLPAANLDAVCQVVQEFSGEAGVYLGLNPVPPDLNRPHRVGDVLRRRWLLVDVDRHKGEQDKDLSATDAERAAAQQLALEVEGYLLSLGWPGPLRIDSGNGYHLLYRLDMPNDEESRKLCKGVLAALHQRFNDARGEVDQKNWDARRISKLPGTWARKGTATAERPHRMARILGVPADDSEVVSAELLQRVAGASAAEAAPAATQRSVFTVQAPPRERSAWAQRALDSECGRVAMARPQTRQTTLWEAACNLGELVGGEELQEADVTDGLFLAGCRAGLDRDPGCGEAGIRDAIRRGIEQGRKHPRKAPERNGHANGHAKPDEAARPPRQDTTADDVATIDDLVAAGAKVEWLWPGWIQSGVLTAVAAKGGTGKTRLCADLLRRIVTGQPWPDGAPMQMSRDSLAMWVIADNHHDEMVTLTQNFGIKDNVRVNAYKDDPYGGVTLDTEQDLAELDRRVSLIRPALVVIDTVGNATDRNLSRQEEAKAFYWPLQIIARKYRTAILCLTHLNASQDFLGKRVLEKVRVALKMSKPDEKDDRRRLEVAKSNSKSPLALGVTMLDSRNDYDLKPPSEDGAESEPKEEIHPRTRECCDWLLQYLKNGSARVFVVRKAAEDAGFSSKTLYKARDIVRAVQFETEGYKYWRLEAYKEVM